MKCKVQEAKYPVRNLVRQRCAEGFKSGVKGLISSHNIHQFCVRVVPPDDEQEMPETCRDIEHQ
jgi:hypothetical protein